MSCTPPFLSTALLGLATAVPAQAWTLRANAPRVEFGVEGDLLAPDVSGLIGWDEVNSQTIQPVLPFAGHWSVLPTPTRPPARMRSTLVSAGLRVYLFGGLDAASGQLHNGLWRFDRTPGDWAPVPPSPFSPGPRPRFGCKAAAPWPGGPVVFFGGYDFAGYCNDTWVMMEISGMALWNSQPTPPGLLGRTRHTMAAGPDGTVVLFGGDSAGALGDTWVFHGASWTQHFGAGPPAAADCRMTFDPGRAMTVLVHPSGGTWEWNGFHWRLVGATGAPPVNQPAVVHAATLGAGLLAVETSASATHTYDFTPSPAAFDYSLDLLCTLGFPGPPSLQVVERSLPVLGQTMRMQVVGLPATAVVFGLFEFTAPNGGSMVPIGCGCSFSLTGVGMAVQLLPRIVGAADWSLPIVNHPALLGTTIDLQGLVYDPAGPCLVTTTERGTLVPGR